MIPLVDLVAQHRAIRSELLEACDRVLQSGHFVLGAEVERFETEFAEFMGVRHAVAVNTGTSALHLALLGIGVGPGDEVITTPLTFVATIAAIVMCGATPVLVDVDPETALIEPAGVASALSSRTKAIVPVHLHGAVAPMERLMALAERHGLAVIEDAAQAHGALYRGRVAGSFGFAGCFSFYPAKNLGACGEGGAIITPDARLATRLRQLRDWGQSERYVHELKGFNYRMDALQAALLTVKLPHLKEWTATRRRHATRYDTLLRAADVRCPVVPPDVDHVYHVYAVRVADRRRTRAVLADAQIATGSHYPIPVHLQPAYADLGYQRGDFPAAERYASETLSLPMFPELTTSQVERVAECLVAAMQPEMVT